MSRTIQFESEPREPIDGSGVQRSHPEKDKSPRFVACLLLLPEEAEQILQLFQKLAVRNPELSTSAVTTDVEKSIVSADMDRWLGHSEAAAYLGVSTSTLYHYSCQEQIERRKLGGRLEYRRSVLDKFKEAHTLPASSAPTVARIITSAHSSGK
jgi:hypothetical protein